MKEQSVQAKNVLGDALEPCCLNPMTGYYRDGHCNTAHEDRASHTVCAQMTTEFLIFSRALGNDLVTPQPEVGFPGLKLGDRWCLCASRWEEAFLAGVAPPIVLASTHENALDVLALDELKAYALDWN